MTMTSKPPIQDKPYYTVVVRDGPTKPWGVHYGSYSKGAAMEEAFEATMCGYARSDVKLLRTTDVQSSINAAVEALNASSDPT